MENKHRSPGECPARELFWQVRKSDIISCDRVTRSTYLQMQSAQNLPIAHPDCPAARSRRKRKGNAMPISDWQSSAAYEHAQDIAAAGMAWEYLRRDDEYCRAFQRTKTLPAPKPRGSEAFSERWGCSGFGAGRQTGTAILVKIRPAALLLMVDIMYTVVTVICCVIRCGFLRIGSKRKETTSSISVFHLLK